ncbi:spastin isoform X1 [Aplysia californica]|uniref:Spastin n=1 Tax=Aplysia californica TaxID=6500 RepID=A0ABM0JRA5_APLCA|nr:spastin isoform X1 [Aplysia californica]
MLCPLGISWRMGLIMNRKGPGGSRLPGKRKGDKPNRIVRRNISIHGRNFRIFATPLLVIFIFVRSLAYQFFLAIILVAQYSRRIVTGSRHQLRGIEACPATPITTMSNNSRGKTTLGPGEPALATQKKHHRKAFEYISKALKIDEEDGARKDIAMELYKKGISELEKGIAVDVCGQGETYDRARRLKDKMQTNLVMVKDRLDILEKQAESMNFDEKTQDKAAASDTEASSLGRLRLEDKPSTSRTKDSSKHSSQFSRPSSALSGTKAPSRFVSHNQTVASKPLRHKGIPMTVNRGGGGTNATSRFGSSGKERKSSTSSSPGSSPIPGRRRPTHSRQASQPDIRSCTGQRDISNVKLKNVDKKLADTILSEIVDQGPSVTFSDIAGQDTAKQALQEIVILPAFRPELFTGLRAPARGLLLFGPPGNGKTLLAKAVANESKSVFFNISASSLTSKWVGEGEKLVRTLFTAARQLQPSIIFIDEIDSLLCERREGENDASRRLKTEFLVQFDGVASSAEDKILVMGATNRPQELDDAVLRRFPKRVYVMMPDCPTRRAMLSHLLSKHGNPLSQKELDGLAKHTEGYSGSDLNALAKDAALGPIRELSVTEVKEMDANRVRSIQLNDFRDSLKRIRRSVPLETIARYESWNREYGDITV